MFYKKVTLFFLIFILLFNSTGCSFKKEVSREKQLNLYIGVKDKENLNTIKTLTDLYKKKNPKLKLNVNNFVNDKIDSNIVNNNDILFIKRDDMFNFSRKGLISDMKNFYTENNIANRYYSVMKSYGRFNDKYYGIPIIPYTFELLYNKKYFEKEKIKVPETTEEFHNLLKKINSTSEKVPVILNEGMDINNGLFSLMAANELISMSKLQEIYDSSPEKYKELTYIQKIFNNINNLTKSGYITKDTFQLGNESAISKFDRGEIPLIFMSSYYINDIKSQYIGSLDEKLPNIKIPVISNMVMCIPTKSSNAAEVDDFMKFTFGDKMQKEFSRMGFVTGIKNTKIQNKGAKNIVLSHIKNSTEDTIAIVYNIPYKIVRNISSKIDDIFSGKYTGNEWNDIINSSY
ncbi:ABC-type glycerol-3-phosphate transport system substrate-binding protein [Clostridium algifaecis]|uniref:ABC-type glycerol-3-phosphate transport system substrate-binding protein n=1 Tax=Clostridium algifaecis TaxID=1472040 RepID=A0ABS4KVA7_9CLOT|nr:extracellular solute-binding protein [Clostridium algifaecis]MBP2032784.1 ABC-type glycerol-3-phosphate transport system substrate-binding protein [Clostridium algifaecis]